MKGSLLLSIFLDVVVVLGDALLSALGDGREFFPDELMDHVVVVGVAGASAREGIYHRYYGAQEKNQALYQISMESSCQFCPCFSAK